MDVDRDFEAAVEEFLAGTRELIGRESGEDVPPAHGPPDGRRAARIPSAIHIDEETIRRYALSIGDDNPLFTDRGYAAASPWGGVIAPGPILVHARYPPDHGASRPNGYPVANFIGGVAWEFFDVVRPGTRVSTNKVLREVLERRGLHGRRVIHLVSEVTYFDVEDRVLAKAYATLLQVPMRTMGATRAMPVERLREELLSDRAAHHYQPDEVAEIVSGMEGERRRGAEPLYWEDVDVGDELPPIVQPPYTMHDALSYLVLHNGLFAGLNGGRSARTFTPAYRAARSGWGTPDFSRVHPLTRWPYTPGDEHEDTHLCAYRGLPLPFDFGIQRGQIPQRLLGNWAGDHAFCRKMSMTMGRALFHGDALVVRGRVSGKARVADPCIRDGHGHSVRVAMEGVNQLGELVSRGFATIYLPSRATGAAPVPVGLDEPPPYVPFAEHRSAEWY